MDMQFILIGATAGDEYVAEKVLAERGLHSMARSVSDGVSRIAFQGGDAAEIERAVRERLAGRPVDLFVRPCDLPPPRLFLADMDATMVEEETLDELAAHLNLRDHIAAITQRAMRGEIDFAAAVRERVALLAGLPRAAVEETLAHITPSPGAAALVAGLKRAGVHTVLISGGFTLFTAAVAQRLGFDEHHGNQLELTPDGSALTGTVAEPIRGKEYKLAVLQATAERLGIGLDQTIAIGDGANDLPMLQAAGLGIGWRAKPAVAAAVRARIDHADMTAVLHYAGIAI